MTAAASTGWPPCPASSCPSGCGGGGRRAALQPGEHVADAGEREVYDVSVPMIHAFVANGIVNHNTINMPEEATVDEVEDLHVEAWSMGLKAIAIYRDNCKVAQPLSTQKKEASGPRRARLERIVETIIAPGAGPAEAAPAAELEDVLVPGGRLPRLRHGGRVRRRPPRARSSSRWPSRARPWPGSWTPSPSPCRTACSTACPSRRSPRCSSTCASSRRASPTTPTSAWRRASSTTSSGGWPWSTSPTRSGSTWASRRWASACSPPCPVWKKRPPCRASRSTSPAQP